MTKEKIKIIVFVLPNPAHELTVWINTLISLACSIFQKSTFVYD